MVTMKKLGSLFNKEENIIQNAEEILKIYSDEENELVEAFKQLTYEYKRLYRQDKKLFRISDNLQDKLTEAQSQIEKSCYLFVPKQIFDILQIHDVKK
jgi:ABC-type transporter Mla subunit MlaD